jgi:hypothetical protein
MGESLKIFDHFRAGCGALSLLGLAFALLVWTAAAFAQQTIELPVPQSQATQPLSPSPKKAKPLNPPANNVQTIPAQPASPPLPPPPQAEQPQPLPPPPPQAEQPLPPAAVAPQPEVVLPAVFRGCWRGVVDDVDRMQRLPGSPRLGLWMPKTYMLCYRRVGDGPFQLTFTAAGVRGTNIINKTGQLKLISTDGRRYARMRAYLHFDEFRRPALFGTGSSTFPVDEVTDLQCTIEPDGMHAAGQVYGEREAQPWFRAWWHTTFFHVGHLPE